MADWIPSEELAHQNLLTQYGNYLAPNYVPLGVTLARKDAFLSLISNFATKKTARNTYEASGATIYQALRDAKEALDSEWRTMTAEIQARRETTDEQRAGLGIPIADETPTAGTTPTSKPIIVKVDANQRLTQILHFRDENTPNSKARPANAKRAILFLKIGTAPTGPSDMEEVASDNKTPYLRVFDDADAGKTAHWALCWENAPGQRGPLSPVTPWTIPG